MLMKFRKGEKVLNLVNGDFSKASFLYISTKQSLHKNKSQYLLLKSVFPQEGSKNHKQSSEPKLNPS